MPRLKRVKEENGIYHVMSRSISEIDLFRSDEDKERYVNLIKECQNLYSFKIYAYCLMDNHVHLIVDSNGANVSKIMHRINFKYANYYNKSYKRHGHLFQDRFKSKIVNNNRYLLNLSAYIHNNPYDLPGYGNKPEGYKYSSLAVYLGLKKDPFNIVDKDFILSILGRFKKKSQESYRNLVMRMDTEPVDNINEEEAEFVDELTEYRSERKILIRNFKTEDIMQFIVDKFNIAKTLLYLKNQKESIPARAMLVLLLRKLCNMSCKDICGILGNITSAGVSKLSNSAVELISNDKNYQNITNDFLACYC